MAGLSASSWPAARRPGRRFIDALELFYHVANIGDARSLAIHPATTTHSQLSPAEQDATGVSDGYVRLSVGIEHIDDIIADLERGFAAVAGALWGIKNDAEPVVQSRFSRSCFRPRKRTRTAGCRIERMLRATETQFAPGRGRIYNSILDTIGDTPIVRLDKLAKEKGVKANLLAKLEFFNPIASVKDRIGVAMIDALEKAGKLSPARPSSSSRPRAIPASRSPSWRRRRATA